ncbi:hypothetical protein Bhyg_00413 [Pseudolycoriella hygida]|uniref:SnoaL-like domain-containing protein n=1 Tax=Pseudolycoriella hygida TaxID=35572 RepID=A0A9Q0MNX0_9DIPT|nr:hypothetical protein Bhyg_17650 [Pseudolycoriella hygida]KAJ6635166.1 hypothetical protein Bhyg_13749 [Pseudolycoriella hygida]KAJ6642256.1 hypothetical protein Bhyg_07203 [Pseudolycoriella hygida]KAJ6645210.1 hypothetical protein Bhyg_00413 [Pseudolycoriella hygida]
MNIGATIIVGVVLVISAKTVTAESCGHNLIKEPKCLKREQVEKKNLDLVLKFYNEAFGQHDISAVDRYISPDYIQHNPQAPDGPQGLKDFLVPFNANKKKGPVDIRHVAVRGDIVWLHVKTTGFKGEPWGLVDIFRVEDDKIVEHWDVIQEIPPISESKNSHPMF